MSKAYDPDDNSRKCYDLAIKTMRLQGIREGRFEPIMSIPEERAAWHQRQVSKGMKQWWARRKAAKNVG